MINKIKTLRENAKSNNVTIYDTVVVDIGWFDRCDSSQILLALKNLSILTVHCQDRRANPNSKISRPILLKLKILFKRKKYVKFTSLIFATQIRIDIYKIQKYYPRGV